MRGWQVDAAKQPTQSVLGPLGGHRRDRVLSDLAPQFAEAGLGHAEELAQDITDETPRYETPAHIVSVVAEAMPSRAVPA